MNHGIVHLLHRLSAALSGAGITWSWTHHHGNLTGQVVATCIFGGAFLAQTNWKEIYEERERIHSLRDRADRELHGGQHGPAAERVSPGGSESAR